MFTVRCRYMPRTPSLNDSSILGCDKTDRAVWQTVWTCQHQRHQTNRRSAATDIISTRKSSNAITGRIRKPSVANGGNKQDVSKETIGERLAVQLFFCGCCCRQTGGGDRVVRIRWGVYGDFASVPEALIGLSKSRRQANPVTRICQ